ncbi:O-antigen ligase family protein [Comamonas sp. Y6]|uniref:O-antigen ligase family protein n=1 Tax=Comamonas resistens TaxID=3046670 RepID=A0ABY8SYB2_9BURK|nr:O-antigen ligase family protein [Comamonas resistens]MDL5037120.1 O-antigen ligase family protein [Comamonas resistens]WHS68052.1 O-antigen ligase family protein [Comamonas resistens]
MILIMGLLWSMSFDRLFSAAGWGYGTKYALAALSLWYLSKTGVRLSAIVWGLACGALGALAIAAYQAGVLKMPRVSGFTNAIQYGGIAMYLGFAAVAVAILGRWGKWQAAALGLLGACGILASFLSDSRGSWVVTPLLIAAIWLMAWLNGFKKLASMAAAIMVVLGVLIAVPAYNKLEQRTQEASREVSEYLQDPQKYATTSVGQRLEQWRLAIHLIEQRPISGWGLAGYPAAKQKMVDQGLAHPSVMEYGHAHNEILDMWVKRGLLGLILLLLFYAVPAIIFWPTHKRLNRVHEEMRSKALALRAAATLLPLAYFGFGWTQVFFAHNSGNMFYIFGLAVLWGGICRLEAQSGASPQA